MDKGFWANAVEQAPIPIAMILAALLLSLAFVRYGLPAIIQWLDGREDRSKDERETMAREHRAEMSTLTQQVSTAMEKNTETMSDFRGSIIALRTSLRRMNGGDVDGD